MDTLPPAAKANSSRKWLDLNHVGQVKITSEDSDHPIDDALIPGIEKGWSAKQSGKQTLVVRFHAPQNVKRVRLIFKEDYFSRTQEFLLRWSKDGSVFEDVVRQQYNFSPGTMEIEEYEVNLKSVKALQLIIVPDISGGPAIATLSELRIA
jgi:hypothetical protein